MKTGTSRTRSLLAWAMLAALVVGTTGAVAGGTATASPASARAGQSTGACTVDSLDDVRRPGLTVTDATPVTDGRYAPPGTSALTGLPDFCAVTAVQRDRAGHPMHIALWMPEHRWNHGFEGVGGGGYSCGISWPALAVALRAGYASASTDCGDADPADALTGAFALRANGTLDRPLIDDFARDGIHDMSVDGPALTHAFYRRRAGHTYFDGCSGGGREALMEAQRFPGDYDGILAASPAINWTRFVPAEYWPQLVMARHHDVLPACKETAFTEAVVRACDSDDGVTDGVIADPDRCRWDPSRLVGTSTPCGTITAVDADVVRQIWDGPRDTRGRRLWFGLERGASLVGLAHTGTDARGVTTADPWPVSLSWLTSWLQHDPKASPPQTYTRFDRLFRRSVREFSPALATDRADLSRFRARGGKLLIWHGLADQLIFPQGSVRYYRRVEAATGGRARTARFARLFLAPGAAHCAAIPPFSPTHTAGAPPTDAMQALSAWVRHDRAPTRLRADTVDPTTGLILRSRPLCAYPSTARYDGHGSTDEAHNFICTRNAAADDARTDPDGRTHSISHQKRKVS